MLFGRGSSISILTAFGCGSEWSINKFDTAGQGASGDATVTAAIRRATGVFRVSASAVSRHHAPGRRTFSPTAVRGAPAAPAESEPRQGDVCEQTL